MGLTTDRNHQGLGRGVDKEPISQHDTYLVLPEEERAKGFVRPLRTTYTHVGSEGPRYPLLDLTPEKQERVAGTDYVKFEAYPDDGSGATGRYWTQEQLDKVGKGCGTTTTMNQAIAETYARSPHFYGATYCCGCSMHLPVDEFIWPDGSRVGS